MKKLHLQHPQHQELEQQFCRWLQLLGYCSQSCYYLPLHIREFLNYLESSPPKVAGTRLTHVNLVRQQELETYLHYLQQERCHLRNGYPLSKAHLNKHVQALNLLNRYLTEIGAEVMSWHLPLFRVTEPAPRVLSLEQIEKLYSSCSSTPLGMRDKALLSLLYGCGLRRGEALSLRVEDIRLQNNQVYIRRAKGNMQRYVPLSPGVAKDLQQYLSQGRPFLLKVATDALLLSSTGKALGGGGMIYRLRLLLKKSNLPAKGIHLHTLRHSIATHLLQAGMRLQSISRFLGHTSLESTQRYTHITNEL